MTQDDRGDVWMMTFIIFIPSSSSNEIYHFCASQKHHITSHQNHLFFLQTLTLERRPHSFDFIMVSPPESGMKLVVILFGSGGLSDVGRHVVQAVLEYPIGRCRILTQHPELLHEQNWNCGCHHGHSSQWLKREKDRIEIIPVNSWRDENIMSHFQGACAVVSCLGNRQPFIGDWVAYDGNQAVIKGMTTQNVNRVVVLSSVGVEEDWPPMEFTWRGAVLGFIFMTLGRPSFFDLTAMEKAYQATSQNQIDYLIVRPVGLDEANVPVGEWYLQKGKNDDSVGVDMAKLDCARFMAQEALNPTIHRRGVVVGSRPENYLDV